MGHAALGNSRQAHTPALGFERGGHPSRQPQGPLVPRPDCFYYNKHSLRWRHSASGAATVHSGDGHGRGPRSLPTSPHSNQRGTALPPLGQQKDPPVIAAGCSSLRHERCTRLVPPSPRGVGGGGAHQPTRQGQVARASPNNPSQLTQKRSGSLCSAPALVCRGLPQAKISVGSGERTPGPRFSLIIPVERT